MSMISLATDGSESSVRDYVKLLKPGVMALVVFTGACGLLVAPGTMHPLLMAVAVLCIAAGSGAGAAINMWYDRDIDAVMHRTLQRPLPSGVIPPEEALAMGIIIGLSSVMLMGLAINWVAAFWLGFAIFFYAVIYTMWLKRRTPQNIVIGGAAGSFPPLIGWAAMTGSTPWEAWVLFAIIFLWTPPHFWALALYRNQDYQRARVPMMPVVRGLDHTKKQMLAYTLLLAPVCFLPCVLGVNGWLYGIAATLLNGQFIYHAVRVLKSESEKDYRRMFGFSILYLFAIFGAMVLDSWLMARLG
jgi:protoheme IX farnesyltransferase